MSTLKKWFPHSIRPDKSLTLFLFVTLRAWSVPTTSLLAYFRRWSISIYIHIYKIYPRSVPHNLILRPSHQLQHGWALTSFIRFFSIFQIVACHFNLAVFYAVVVVGQGCWYSWRLLTNPAKIIQIPPTGCKNFLRNSHFNRGSSSSNH